MLQLASSSRLTHVQDNDRSQYNFVSALYGLDSSVFLVGDLDQAIYQFRGADVCFPLLPLTLTYGVSVDSLASSAL